MMTLRGRTMTQRPLRWHSESLSSRQMPTIWEADPSVDGKSGRYDINKSHTNPGIWSKNGDKLVRTRGEGSKDSDAEPVCTCSGFLNILSRFAERTSMQGVPNIRASTSIAGRLTWSFLFLVCMTLLSGHLYYLCYSYYSYPKHSVIELGFSALVFPAVTFCNVNPLKRSKLPETPERLRTLVSRTDPDEIAKKMAGAYEHTNGRHKRSIPQGQLTRQLTNMSASYSIHDGEPGHSSTQRPQTTKQGHRGQSRTVGRWKRHNSGDRGKLQKRDGSLVGNQTSDERSDNRTVRHLMDRGGRERSLHDGSSGPPLNGTRRSIGTVTAKTLSGNKWASQTGSHTVFPLLTPPAPSTMDLKQQQPSVEGESSQEVLHVTLLGDRKANTTETPHAQKQSSGRKHISFLHHLDLGINFTKVKTMQKVQRQEEEADEADGQSVLKQAFTEPSVTASIREEFIHLYSSMNRSTRAAVGHQLEDMLVDCSFAGKRCLSENFTHLSSFVFGNCFTIDPPDFIVTSSGYRGGLSLTVFLESDEYLRGMTSGTGIHVVIHPHHTMPFPQENGLAIMAGTETNIALKLLNINRLGYPHGVCQDGDEFRKQYNVTYTRRACQHHCEQSMIMDQCGCYNEQGGEIVQMAMNSHLNVCRSESDLGCMLRIQRQFERGSVPCGCENPCNEKDYVKTVSMRHWPADAYTPVLVETLCGHRDARECDKYRQADTRTIAHSFVKLNIFYEDLNYENITEVEDYELPQFASDVGGTVGLWLGLSVLSGFEVVQFLMELATYLLSFSCCHNNCQLHRHARRRVRNKESSRKLSDAFGTERWECSRTRQQPHGSWSSRQ